MLKVLLVLRKLRRKRYVVSLLSHEIQSESHDIRQDLISTFGEIQDFFKKAEEKFSLICAERVMLEEYMREASLEYPSDGKFLALHEKYVNLFKDPISINDDGNEDNGGDDDDRNGDNDEDDGDGNGDEEDANEGDKDPNGSNPSFGFT
ncbi:hypothetical protein Tco_0279614, partial [Tanacetum coccineum]